MALQQKITSNLWFDNHAEEAVNFYVSVFKHSGIQRKQYYTEEGQEFHRKAPGSVMTIEFTLENQQFIALNAGPAFTFNEAISFVVHCETQEEVDHYWDHLSEGGDPTAQMCGWLKDRFGVSWQIIPTILTELTADPDPEKSKKAFRAMLQMKKIDIAALEQAVR